MDSGSTVPTLSPGLSETAAVKLLTVATARCGGCPARTNSSTGAVTAADAADVMLLFRARFLAADNAGSNNAARTEIMTTTTINSMSVKPRRGILINHLLVFCTPPPQHGICQLTIT